VSRSRVGERTDSGKSDETTKDKILKAITHGYLFLNLMRLPRGIVSEFNLTDESPYFKLTYE
jgi:hypothetical protein